VLGFGRVRQTLLSRREGRERRALVDEWCSPAGRIRARTRARCSRRVAHAGIANDARERACETKRAQRKREPTHDAVAPPRPRRARRRRRGRTARTNPQFATGPQKCVVLGPVGELINARNAMADASVNDATTWFPRARVASRVRREWRGVERAGGVGMRHERARERRHRACPGTYDVECVATRD
jgi:hypothetical protein